MKYTNLIVRPLAVVLTMAAFFPTQSKAQAASVSGAPTATSTYDSAPVVNSTIANSDDPQSALITIRKRVDEVNVLFIATDKRGKFVRDLNQNDFPILEDHTPPQAIINFRRETDLPLELGLLIDVSGSVNSRFDFEQNAATSFLQHTIRARFDKAFIVVFNSHSQLAQDFTDNVQLLSASVHKLHNGGGNDLYAALYAD